MSTEVASTNIQLALMSNSLLVRWPAAVSSPVAPSLRNSSSFWDITKPTHDPFLNHLHSTTCLDAEDCLFLSGSPV